LRSIKINNVTIDFTFAKNKQIVTF